MAEANKQTSKIRRKAGAKVKSLQDLPPFEPKYLMRVNAPDVSGDISHDDLVLLVRDEMPKCGDLVCVHRKDGSAILVNLEVGLPEIDWKRMPFEQSAADGCVSVVMGTVFGGTKQFVAPMDKLAAVHKCEGRYDPEQVTA